MAEAGDAGVAATVVALSGTLGPVDELNAVTAGILEGNEAFDVTRRRLAFGAAADGISKPLQLGRSHVQVIAVPDLKSNRLIGGIALEVAERLLTHVRLETDRPFAMLGNFQAEIVDRKPRGPFQILGSEPDIAHIQQADHRSLPFSPVSRIPVRRSRCPRRRRTNGCEGIDAADGLLRPRFRPPRRRRRTASHQAPQK